MILLLGGVLAALGGLSGVARLDAAKDRYKRAHLEYERLHANLLTSNARQSDLIQRLGKLSASGMKQLLRAKKMLQATFDEDTSASFDKLTGAKSTRLALMRADSLSVEFYAAGGLAVGAATAGTLWFGAQVIGIASTGMPVVFLHGAALHNAALAVLGGGALKAGGLGMVGGSAVLASAVATPAAVYFTWKTHSKANEINTASEELERANDTNSSLLMRADGTNTQLEIVESELKEETKTFEAATSSIRRRLFRFGIGSQLFRYMRSRLWGEYYLSNEIAIVDELSSATLRYTGYFENLRMAFSKAE